jgi:hypothetical protein
MTHHPPGPAQSRPLPAYQAIFAVDAVRFSAARSVDQPHLSQLVPAVLEEALTMCGLSELWSQRRFPQGTGDGYVFGTSPEYLPFLVDPLLDQLQATLERRNVDLAERNRELRLRLRVSLHVGPVPDERRESTGEPVIHAFRLLDSAPIKDAMKHGHPDVTLLAAIVSQRLYDDVIRAGYTGIHPSRFEPTVAEVAGKDFAEPALIYIPRPSVGREPTPQEARPEPPRRERSTSPQPGPAGPQTTVLGNVGQSITGQYVSGNFTPVFRDGSFSSTRQPRDDES